MIRWPGLLTAGIVTAILCIFLSRAAEPAYKGKPAGYWLDHLWDLDNNKEPFTAFKVMGSNAVPFLVSVLEQKPSRIADRLDEVRAGHSRLPDFLEGSLPCGLRIERRREHAAYVISQIGPLAAAAIPALLHISRDANEDERVQREAFDALMAMGGSLAGLVPQFIRDLKSDDEDTRRDALNLLRSAGPAAKPAVPLIFDLLKAKRVEPYPAARAVWSIARLTNTAIEIFTNGLPTTNSARNELAMYYLREMGSAAACAAPAVVPMLESPISSSRMQAETLLREIAPAALELRTQELNARQDASLARIISILQSDERDCSRALEALQVLGPAGKAAVPALIERLQQFSSAKAAVPSSSVLQIMEQVRLAEALAEIGPDARPAVPALLARIQQRHGQMFFKALGRIGPDARDAVPLLECGLLDKDCSIRLASADTLTRIAPQQCSNAVAILEALKFDQELATTWVPGTNPGPFMLRKQDFENPTSKYYRLAASVPLWKLGLEKQSPMQDVLKQLEQSGSGDEKQYIELLGDLGPEARPALPKLATFLQQNCVSDLRRAAAIAIRKIDPVEAARLALPGLLAVP